MELNNATFLAYLNAGIISCLLSFIIIARIRGKHIHCSLLLAAVTQSAWLSALAFQNYIPRSALEVVNLLESLHYTTWTFALAIALTKYCSRHIPKHFYISIGGSMLAINIYNIIAVTTPQLLLTASTVFVWQGLYFSIIGLFCAEQLFRNSRRIRLLKLLSLNIAIMFIYDVLFFTQQFIQAQEPAAFVQVRAIIALVTGLFIALNVIVFTRQDEAQEQAELSLSRPIVFYTTSLTIAGSVLVAIGLGGYYIRVYGGDWGQVIYSVILVGAVVSIALVFTSRTVREHLGVLINKHLFSHKYDYRAEWLKLINQLSKFSGQTSDDIYKRAVTSVARIFKCHGGALWLKRGPCYVPVHQHNIGTDICEFIEPTNSNFSHTLTAKEWVFFPTLKAQQDSLKQHNEYLPDWAENIPKLWLIMPLMIESKLEGYIVLTESENGLQLNWEDLDLLKTVGRQIASYLKRHEQAKMLAESAQFDTFNKLAAYVMHDLKNIIAQQSLVVKNAEKHKDNPAFVDDAMSTVNNSVDRMNILLRKLQRNEPEEVRTLTLNDTLVEGVQRCNKYLPAPTLRCTPSTIKIKADWDSLVMVFVHIIQNAQDATPNTGFVDVSMTAENNAAIIVIEDNGQGMDESFIRERLFKPFETTKSGKGMGIGVYQARDYIQSLGGNITVESQLDEGTTFTVTLPYLEIEAKT